MMHDRKTKSGSNGQWEPIFAVTFSPCCFCVVLCCSFHQLFSVIYCTEKINICYFLYSIKIFNSSWVDMCQNLVAWILTQSWSQCPGIVYYQYIWGMLWWKMVWHNMTSKMNSIVLWLSNNWMCTNYIRGRKALGTVHMNENWL